MDKTYNNTEEIIAERRQAITSALANLYAESAPSAEYSPMQKALGDEILGVFGNNFNNGIDTIRSLAEINAEKNDNLNHLLSGEVKYLGTDIEGLKKIAPKTAEYISSLNLKENDWISSNQTTDIVHKWQEEIGPNTKESFDRYFKISTDIEDPDRDFKTANSIVDFGMNFRNPLRQRDMQTQRFSDASDFNIYQQNLGSYQYAANNVSPIQNTKNYWELANYNQII